MHKVYIAGKITDNPDFERRFAEKEKVLKANGYVVLNPAKLPPGMGYEDYMHICFAMIAVCDSVCFLDNWKESPGAIREHHYAQALGKGIWLNEE